MSFKTIVKGRSTTTDYNAQATDKDLSQKLTLSLCDRSAKNKSTCSQDGLMHYPSRSLVLYFSFDLVRANMCTSQVFTLVEPMELDLLFMYP